MLDSIMPIKPSKKMLSRRNDGMFKAVKHMGSQALLAEATGYNQSTISRYLYGKYPLTYEAAICIENACKIRGLRYLLAPNLFKKK